MGKKADRRALNRRVEIAKRNLAHSTPLFNPRDSWTPRLKIGGVPAATLLEKQHQPVDNGYRYYW